MSTFDDFCHTLFLIWGSQFKDLDVSDNELATLIQLLVLTFLAGAESGKGIVSHTRQIYANFFKTNLFGQLLLFSPYGYFFDYRMHKINILCFRMYIWTVSNYPHENLIYRRSQ